MPFGSSYGSSVSYAGAGYATRAYDNDSIDAPCQDYLEMQLEWDLIHDLLGGTLTMRLAGERWLPKEPAEEQADYNNRIKRSVLFEGLRDTIEKHADKPFSEELTYEGELPLELEPLKLNADRQGTTLDTFAKDMFVAADTHGLVHVLTEYPLIKERQTDPSAVRLDTEDREGIRPYFCLIRAPDLLGWKWKTNPLTGEKKLVEIRYRELRNEPVGLYGEAKVWYVIRYTDQEVEVHRFNAKDDKFEIVADESGPHTFGSVPLRTLYFKKTGYMRAEPPNKGLAWLNLAHWQSASDQRNIVHIVRVPVLACFGASDTDTLPVIGANYIAKFKDTAASLKWVEVTGAAVELGQKDMDKLESQMEVLGLEPYVEATQNTTATARRSDEGRSNCKVKTWLRDEERVLREMFEDAAEWINVTLSDAFKVGIFSDFQVYLTGATDMPVVLSMVDKKMLTREQGVLEAKRRRVVMESVDAEEMVADAMAAGPSMADVRAFGAAFAGNGAGGDQTPNGGQPGNGQQAPPVRAGPRYALSAN